MSGRGLGSGRLFKKKDWWFFEWTDGHRKVHRKRLSTDRRIAERIRNEILKNRDLALQGLANEGGLDLPLAQVIACYLDDLKVSHSPAYVKKVTTDLARLRKAFGSIRVRDASIQLVLKHRKDRLTEGVSHATVNLETGALRACFNWAVCADMIGANPLARLKPLPQSEAHQKRPRRAMTEDEIGRFLHASEELDAERESRFLARKTITHGTKGRRYAERERQGPITQTVLWHTIIITGLRWGETAGLMWSDYNPTAKSLVVRAATTKGKRSRVVPVEPSLGKALEALRKAQERSRGRAVWPAEPIFLTPLGKPWVETGSRYRLNLFNKILQRARIAKADEAGRRLDIHALRATAATRMARHGVPLAMAAKILGHQDPKITAKHYTDLRLADALAAVEKLPPVTSSVELREGA